MDMSICAWRVSESMSSAFEGIVGKLLGESESKLQGRLFPTYPHTIISPGMANKRKREDSDLDEPAPGKQILPVANLPKDFDGNPANGMEYLFLVR